MVECERVLYAVGFWIGVATVWVSNLHFSGYLCIFAVACAQWVFNGGFILVSDYGRMNRRRGKVSLGRIYEQVCAEPVNLSADPGALVKVQTAFTK